MYFITLLLSALSVAAFQDRELSGYTPDSRVTTGTLVSKGSTSQITLGVTTPFNKGSETLKTLASLQRISSDETQRSYKRKARSASHPSSHNSDPPGVVIKPLKSLSEEMLSIFGPRNPPPRNPPFAYPYYPEVVPAGGPEYHQPFPVINPYYRPIGPIDPYYRQGPQVFNRYYRPVVPARIARSAGALQPQNLRAFTSTTSNPFKLQTISAPLPSQSGSLKPQTLPARIPSSIDASEPKTQPAHISLAPSSSKPQALPAAISLTSGSSKL